MENSRETKEMKKTQSLNLKFITLLDLFCITSNESCLQVYCTVSLLSLLCWFLVFGVLLVFT